MTPELALARACPYENPILPEFRPLIERNPTPCDAQARRRNGQNGWPPPIAAEALEALPPQVADDIKEKGVTDAAISPARLDETAAG
jgi:hypothetical protein